MRARRAGALAAGVAAGALLGYGAERLLLRPRLVPAVGASRRPPSRVGERTTVAGPGGLAVAVESHGGADVPTVVFAHGWMCDRSVWRDQVVALADRARLVTYDQPGHGETPGPDGSVYDLDMLGDTLLAVVEACAPTGPIVLVGHSLGGMTVLNALRRHVDRLTVRVSGVVLVSTTASARNERRGIEAGIRGFARSRRVLSAAASGLRDRRVLRVTRRLAGVSNDATMLVVRSFGLGPDVDARVADTVARMVLACPPETALGLVDALLSVDEDEALALLPPTTALVGERDMLTPVVLTRRMVTLSKGRVRARELARIGHMVPLEAPEALTDAIVEHLSSAEDARDAVRSAS